MQNMPNGTQLNTPQNMQQFAQQAMQQPQYAMAGGVPYSPYGQPPQEEDDDRKKKGFIFWIIFAGIALVIALLVGLWMFLGSTQWKGDARLGQLDNKSVEEIQAELDRIVEEGMMQISIASVAEFADGASEGELRIENAPSNKYAMQVDIKRKDNGEVIYTSDVLDPNYHIQFAPLDVDLPAGTYECIATFHALEQGSHEEMGQAAAKITIVVNN